MLNIRKIYRAHNENNQEETDRRTCCGLIVKVRFKLKNDLLKTLLFAVCIIINFNVSPVKCNRPPRFLIDGQTEIVLRLKEGEETPVGKMNNNYFVSTLIYKLRGIDPDGDSLGFGVRTQSDSDVIRIESTSATEADIYLNHELDRETKDEYALVLTLTDGRLGFGNYITQSLLILVEDVNDNVPIFKSFQPSITLRENASPGIITTLEATDADEGAYGQVIYQLQQMDTREPLFGISTNMGKAIIRLIGQLDYETQTLHQLKILAVDRAKHGRINTGTAAILIKVEDVEDQSPEFVRVQPVARVAEDAPIGTQIMQVKAIDGDRGINNPISYSLSTNSIFNEPNLFIIDKMTGIISTKRLLDREAISSSSAAYILQISAIEIGSSIFPAPSAQTEITIMITDVNDETPTFRSKNYECEIGENAAINTPVTFLGKSIPEVFDYDQGNNGTFNLFLRGAEDVLEIAPTKAINEATFLIRVKNSTRLDYEQIKSINFSIVAREVVDVKPKYSEAQVILHILDRNDNFPEFIKNVYEVWIPENCKIGTTVAWVQALDEDSGNYGTKGIRYTNLSGASENLLYLHPTTGVITVKTAGGPDWDRELVQRHHITVEARDDLGNGNRNTVQLVINIEDINDNPPIFLQNLYEARLIESNPDFENPLKVEARDSDLNGTDNSKVIYTLYGEMARNFTIDRLDGTITPRNTLDFEQIPGPSEENVRQLKLIVRASDLGMPTLFSDVPLTIYIQDVNDHAPIFEKLFYNVTIPENTSSGVMILQVKAIDLDGSYPNNQIIYRIHEGASNKFTIDSETGVISVARGVNLDPDLMQTRKTRYTLSILAMDGALGNQQLHAYATVNITVMDINNKSPIFITPGKITIMENTMVGTLITKFNATDLDSTAAIRYSLDPTLCEAKNEQGILLRISEFNCSDYFQLNQFDGTLRIAKLIDREMTESIKLGVKAEDVAADTGPQIATANLIIDVEDTNDNNPKFRSPYYKFSVNENSKSGTLIGSVVADDLDRNRSMIYILEGHPDILNLVHLHNNTGDLLVSNKIDHEVYNWINMTVKAIDSGIPPRYSRTEVYIQILDENDNNPYFLSDPRVLMVPENTEVGQKIAVLEARDPDSGEFGKITYLLDRISSEGKFSLDPNTGILRVAQELDRETKQTYLLVVEAWDNYQYGFNSGESRNAFKHINVTILDVNDNPPQLVLPSNCISITEFHEPKQAIIEIHASDADDPETVNGQIIMNIASGNEERLFALQQINEWTAEIRVLRQLRGKHGNYSLILRAQDLGTPSHHTEGHLNICVTDFNDHAPMFISPPYNSTLRVPENATIGSALVQILATDEDVGSNGMVRYRLKADPAGHWKTFNLQPVSGILELRLPLNRAKQKIYDIRIEAYDLGIPTPLTSDLDLTVYVSNINDYQPQFLVDEFVANFTEHSGPGFERSKLPETIDRDELEFDGPPTPICYYIVGGNENRNFRLDKFTHELTINRELDREERDSYILLVKAAEDCNNSPRIESSFDSLDDTLLKVLVNVADVNDNPPRFIHRIFTGGVSTATSFGTKFMQVKAEDLDYGENAVISYYLIGQVQMTLTEGLENLQRPPFLVEKNTGVVRLNFDPQQGMKGYFDFMVLANDTGGLQDTARVFIYLLREDQRVRFVLRQQPPELRDRIDMFRQILGNVTGSTVNVDEFRVHVNQDGSIDKTRTDLYLHLVDRADHSILEVDEVLKLIDQNTEKLDTLFKANTQPAGPLALASMQTTGPTFWLSASSLFLLLLLFLSLALCINQRQTYQRKLKAATATAYVRADSEIDGRGLSGLSGRVPNTNKHSMEGSNPIWLKAYENEWYKNPDEYSQGSERDSLDENVLSNGEDNQCHHNNIHPDANNDEERPQNVYQTVPPLLPPRKLETTEL
ncbi:fat atypical cadherin-related [Holotrichia oblita]|uniref:Fat atypical cadherin-related n=1 Tax=Holotrichia oblita TaxID=644536 RepID=A0ACB9STF2_HOLOL|nr:fat atypical cadherin-related [Holotrichia oblita]